MYSIFWIGFGICLIIDMIRSGEAYMLFYRYMMYMNQLKEPTVNFAKEFEDKLLAEYHFGRRIYGINIKKVPPSSWNEWAQVAIFKELVNTQIIDPVSGKVVGIVPQEDKGPLVKTGKIEYYAGPYKNFHNKRDTPKDLNRKYAKLAFMYPDNSVIHVTGDEVIIDKLQHVRAKYDKQA